MPDNNALINRIQKRMGLVRAEAILGNSSGTLYDPQITGNVFVRYQTSTGDGWPNSVRCPDTFVSFTPGTAVWVGYDYEGQLAVLSARKSAQLAAGQSPFTNYVQSDPTGGFLDLSQAATLRCQPTEVPSLSVTLKAWAHIVDGTIQLYSGEIIDLTAEVPATPGEHCATGIFVDTATNLAVVQSSTPKSVLDDINFADFQEIITAVPSTAVLSKFWRLPNGITEITDEYASLDGRQWLNVASTGSTSTFDFGQIAELIWIGLV